MRNILLIIPIFFAVVLPSCINDDITTSSSAILDFSKDTVNLGVLFTDLSSPTARLVVRNNNNKGVNISSIHFADPSTPFRFNVDGVSGSYFENVEIRANDSIYVFIECYLNADDSPEPFLVSDRLEFVTNGVSQSVEVEATGWNVTRLEGQTLDKDFTMTAERPYIIFDSLTVAKGATLNIEPGTKVLFHDKAELIVRGTLNAVGKTGEMIDFRGDRLDDVLPDVGYDILAGQWKGVRITEESFNNRMEFVDMRSTSEGLLIDSCADINRQKLTLVNSWLHNSQSNVLNSQYCKVDAYGCCFSEAAGSVVSLTGGSHQFIQCTIANYYLFSFYGGTNLALYHCLPQHAEENQLPLMQASFENCIIWGDIGDPINIGDLEGSNVFLKYVLLKADGTDDANFINCIWNENPLFETVRADYYFNYHLQPESPAIGAGNPDYINEITEYDMDGVYRLDDIYPSLGAYQE